MAGECKDVVSQRVEVVQGLGVNPGRRDTARRVEFQPEHVLFSLGWLFASQLLLAP